MPFTLAPRLATAGLLHSSILVLKRRPGTDTLLMLFDYSYTCRFTGEAATNMFLLTSPITTIITLLGGALGFALIMQPKDSITMRQLCLAVSFLTLCIAILMGLSFDKAATGYQFVSSVSFVAEYNTSFAVGVDGLSYIFLVLTLFTFPFLFLAA